MTTSDDAFQQHSRLYRCVGPFVKLFKVKALSVVLNNAKLQLCRPLLAKNQAKNIRGHSPRHVLYTSLSSHAECEV